MENVNFHAKVRPGTYLVRDKKPEFRTAAMLSMGAVPPHEVREVVLRVYSTAGARS